MLIPYEKYKNANLPWLDVIPEHWDFLRNKNVFTDKKNTVGSEFNRFTLLSLTKGGVIARDISSGKGKFPKDFNSYKIVEPGDMIFCLFDIDETPRTVGLSSLSGMITGAYNVFQVKNNNPHYTYYYYLALDNLKALKPLYTGLRKVIGLSTFMATKLPIPPRFEQDQIVRFLDWKTTDIARYIKEKKKEITYLTELKNSLIFHAVTKGCRPNAKKMSQQKWIGDIPVHWDEKMLFQCATEQNISNKNVHNQNLLSLSYGKIINKDINTTAGLLPASFDTYQIIHKGNIILRLTDLQNDHKSLRVGLSAQTGIITSAYTCLKPRENVLSEYLYLLLHSYDVSKLFYGMGGGVRQSIGYNDIRRMTVLLPPKEEQEEIVSYCLEVKEKIDLLIDSIKSEIGYLEELRTKTIVDVVTGKVDVRSVYIPEYEVITNGEFDDDDEADTNDESDEEILCEEVVV